MLAGLPPKFNLPYIYELQHFVDCINNDLDPLSSGKDGLADLEAISMAYKNLEPLDSLK
jgi:predicted dehydrogenase